MIFTVNDGSFGFRVNPGTALDFASFEVCINGEFYGDQEQALLGVFLEGLDRLDAIPDDRLDPTRYSPRQVVKAMLRDDLLNAQTLVWSHEWSDEIFFRPFVYAGHFNAVVAEYDRRRWRRLRKLQLDMRTVRRVVMPVAEYREVAAAVGDYWRSFSKRQWDWRNRGRVVTGADNGSET